ncbi:MAG: hypothetical protein HQK63_13500 [Desulfamplus sp.]|nr:hypothetical protein [Desulfamplus sp.]
MKIKFFIYALLISLLIPINGYTLSIQEELSIDIKPDENDLQFCFTLPSYSIANANWQLYVAALINNQLYFVNDQNQPVLWDGSQEAPFFIKNKLGVKTTCLPLLPKTLLQGIPIYAGIGNNLSDIVTNARYTCIFDGTFPKLPQQPRTWTVMVYMIGSTLEAVPQHWATKDLIEMLDGTQQMSSDNVNVILTTGGSTREGWQTVKRTLIQQGQQYVIADLGEQNMASPEPLSDFVPWAVKNFPASHYALIMWDHGQGSLGYGLDSSKAGLAANNGKPDEMTLTELHQAFRTIRPKLAAPLDIISYDACNMATIEVAEITAALANAMSASVEKEPGHGADYSHLFTNLSLNPPDNGIDFGKLLKTGYLEQTRQQLSKTSEKTTWETDQITYSVFDLTQLPSFRSTFKSFADELDSILKNSQNSTSIYKMVSSGIIYAPIYPAMPVNSIRSKRFTQGINEKDVHIDLYGMLQNMLPDIPDLKSYADKLLTQLNQIVIEYDANPNVKKIYQDAGRLSINIGIDLPYLNELPEAYQSFHKAMAYYNQRKTNDDSSLTAVKDCYPPGMGCGALHNWLRLPGSEALEIEAYFGQYTSDTYHIYLMKTIYEFKKEVTKSIELGVDGNQACDYKICVNDIDCQSITLTEHNDQRFAEIILNQNPAILTFCQNEDKSWEACSVTSQINGVWERSSVLYPGDSITPKTLQWKDKKETLEETVGNTFTVEERPVIIKQECDSTKAMIMVSSYAANLQPNYRELCDGTDCVCSESDMVEDDACEKLGTKAGILIEP